MNTDMLNNTTGMAGTDQKIVSKTVIEGSVKYLEDEFLGPLMKTGKTLLETYDYVMNKGLTSVDTNAIFAELQTKIQDWNDKLQTIIDTAAGQMEDSSATIGKSQAEILSILAK